MTATATTGQEKTGAGCLILFGLAFLLPGLFVGVMGIKQTIGGSENGWVGILVGVVFAVVGGGIVFAGFYSNNVTGRENELRNRYPDEPWKWNPEWKGGVVTDSSKGGVIGMAIFAFLWNAISWPALIAAIRDGVFAENKVAYLILLFPLVGIILITSFIYLYLRSCKYGASTLTLETYPGVIGGPFSAGLTIPATIISPDGFNLRLSSFQEYTSGSGKDRRTSEQLLWETDANITEYKQRHRMTELSISFVIPSACRSTTQDNPGHDIIWRLAVEAETDGIDYKSTFEVPVFVTPDSQEGIDPDSCQNMTGTVKSSMKDPSSLSDLCKELGLDYDRPAHGRLTLHFPPARKLSSLIGMFIFFLIWTGIIVGMIIGGVPIFFPIIFGLFDLIFVFILLVALFGSSTIEVTHRGIEITKAFMGVGTPTLIPFDNLKQVMPKISMQSGSKTYYVIEFHQTSGKALTAGSRILGKSNVKRLIAEIQSAINDSRTG